jgi:hypothetical protein
MLWLVVEVIAIGNCKFAVRSVVLPLTTAVVALQQQPQDSRNDRGTTTFSSHLARVSPFLTTAAVNFDHPT